MERIHLAVIQDLMDELQDTMSYGKDDLEGRLGRNKDSELKAMPMKDDGIMGDKPEHKGVNKNPGHLPEDEDIGEDEKLTGRLMRLRA